jgi:hypothetical protein
MVHESRHARILDLTAEIGANYFRDLLVSVIETLSFYTNIFFPDELHVYDETEGIELMMFVDI